MELDEAISHCDEKAMECSPCGEDHRQLAYWLRELRDLRYAFDVILHRFIACKNANRSANQRTKALTERLKRKAVAIPAVPKCCATCDSLKSHVTSHVFGHGWNEDRTMVECEFRPNGTFPGPALYGCCEKFKPNRYWRTQR